jgi:lipoprotein-releasing system permease protein
MNSFSWWLASKHLGKARLSGFLGRVSLLALLGVAIGVATLLTVFAFVGGFEEEVRRLLTEMNPGLFVSSRERGQLADPAMLEERLISLSGVEAASPFIQQKGVMSLRKRRGLKMMGVIIRGVDPATESRVTSILESCDPPFAGFDINGSPGVILGERLAAELGVLPGESLTFTTILDEGTTEAFNVELTVVGMVSSGLYEFDRRFAYADISVCRELFRDNTGVDGLGLRLEEILDAGEVASLLRSELSFHLFRIASWQELNLDIFQWMQTMRVVLFLALSLIIMVAGFNIAGSMTIIVTEKTREIGLLLSLGASRGTILATFLLEGWLIGLLGVALGGGGGMLLMKWFSNHPLSLPGEVYFIDHMPARLSPQLFLAIAGSAVLVAFFALILPGLEALRRTPMDALREGGKTNA